LDFGTAVLEDAAGDSYETSFGQDLSNFFGVFGSRELRTVDLGNETLPVSHADILPETFDGDVLRHCLPKIKNAAYYKDAAGLTYDGYMNSYDGTDYSLNSPICPMIGVHFVLKQVAALAGVTLSGSFMDDAKMKRLHFFATVDTFGMTVMNYADFLPKNLTVNGLLKALTLPPFGINVFFDNLNRTVTLNYLDDAFADVEYLNYSDKVLPDMKPEIFRNKRIELDWQLDSADGEMKIITGDLAALRLGDGEQELVLKGVFSTLKMEAGLPIATMEGITKRIEQAGADFSPRLLFWNGVIADVPTSSITQDGLTLKFDGVGGIADHYWSRFMTFWLNTVPVTLLARLTANDLERFNFHRKAGQNVAFYAHGHYFFVDWIRTELPLNGGISTVRCYLKR
jgi:hypothetical protein